MKKCMATAPTEVLGFPKIRAVVRDNGTAEVVVAGNSRVVPDGESLQDLRNNALAVVVGEAQTLQRPVRVRIEDPEGHGELIVHPDSTIESVSYETHPAQRRAEALTTKTSAPIVTRTAPPPATEPVAAPAEPTAARVATVDHQAWPPTPASTKSKQAPAARETQAAGTAEAAA